MQLTRRGDYAVRVMTDLAARAGSGPVPRIAIQARQPIPGASLAKVVQALQALVTRELETVTIADLVAGRVRPRGSRAAGVLVPWTA